MHVSPLVVVGGFALAVLVAGWLVVSFSPPGRKRTIVEWLSATAMYAALATLFIHLTRNALDADNTIALVAFGFLCAIFGGGFLVSLYQMIVSSKGSGESGTNATN